MGRLCKIAALQNSVLARQSCGMQDSAASLVLILLMDVHAVHNGHREHAEPQARKYEAKGNKLKHEWAKSKIAQKGTSAPAGHWDDQEERSGRSVSSLRLHDET
mmetsp:Transcript_38151/g.76460  ORF Transcript_38151/g.76460 Transcript_38151/m.76460 type:complete len:104 (-) Transcript_38151:228-539(-)